MCKLIGMTERAERNVKYYKSLESLSVRKVLLTNTDIIEYNKIYNTMLNGDELTSLNIPPELAKYVDSITDTSNDIMTTPISVRCIYVDLYLTQSTVHMYPYLCTKCGDKTYVNSIEIIIKRKKLCLDCIDKIASEVKKQATLSYRVRRCKL